MPLFSVITITKANPDGFEKTRASVAAQSFSDYEWVVIDGDREPDAGIYDAMNKGIARARGDYMIFMNAGDIFAGPDVLARVAAVAAGADFIYGDALESGHYKPARHDIARGMVTHHQAMFFKRDARLYDTAYTIAADYKYTAEAILRADKTVYAPFAICVFEAGGVSQRRARLGRIEQAAIRKDMHLRAPMIGLIQRASHLLKMIAPRLYWFLRTRV